VDAFCYLPGHPLCALAAEGKAALLCKVLEQGGDPDAQDSRGYTGALKAKIFAQQLSHAGPLASTYSRRLPQGFRLPMASLL
jgi:hypothetical protein